ncbi:uncharacterized protein PFLUO_LOCUS199 [Penicillium psychrofluorescens]|uniref:uncharacterized protein n=1 Tax=Penicillium psychrofluorescens TaxID=3158075 RepID=UPI003CCD45AB
MAVRFEKSSDVLATLNETVNAVFERFPSTIQKINEVEKPLNALLHPTANATQATQEAAVNDVYEAIIKAVMEGFGWEPPEKIGGETYDEWLIRLLSIFYLTFGYLCICVGLVCFIVGVLTLLSHKYHAGYSRLRYISIGANILVGLGIALLSTAVLTDAAATLDTTYWTLPGLTLILLALVVLQHVSGGPTKLDSTDD